MTTDPHRAVTTHFAPPERAPGEELALQVDTAAHHPLVDGILRTVGGVVAVLNEQRQILSVNAAMCAAFGIADPGEALGLRPGEALNCVHAAEMAGGCGTSRYCSTCGAAVAIVSCLEHDAVSERTCALTVTRNGAEEDLCLQVRAFPLRIAGMRFVILLLLDVTAAEWRAALERTFFHDINNLILGISGLSELLLIARDDEREHIARRIDRIVDLLAREVAIQRSLSHGLHGDYRPVLREVSLFEVVAEVRNLFEHHPAARGRELALPSLLSSAPLRTDYPLLVRVLSNLLTNALEATPAGGVVRVGVEEDPARGHVVFTVWSSQPIPPEVARRVFQRHFSTKDGMGRGLGTYSARLFGERFLGGRVWFTSSAQEGTTFHVSVPRNAPAPRR